MKRSAVVVCFLVAVALLCPVREPRAEMALNGTSFARGGFFSATFRLDGSITRPFTVYAVVFMPDGSMLDALTLGPSITPVASNVPRLDPPFSRPLLSLNLPAGAPFGPYEVVAAFFDPSKPITGRGDAFLDVHAGFAITQGSDWYAQYGPGGTGDVVRIGSVYVASRQEDAGCSWGQWAKWPEAMNYANGLGWLNKDDWRLPSIDELQTICANRESLGSSTAGSVWSSTEPNADHVWWLYFGDCIPHDWGKYSTTGGVRTVRGVEQP